VIGITRNHMRRLLSGSFMAAGVLAIGAMAADIPAQAQGAATPAPAQDTAAPAGRPARATPTDPIPEGDVAALIKQYGLVESKQTAKEMVKDWTKPKMMLVAVDRPDRLAWLQEAVPDVKLVAVRQRGTLAQNEAEALPYAVDADAFVGAQPPRLCIEGLIKAAKNLKWIQEPGAGVDDCIDASPEIAAGKFLFTDGTKLKGNVAENVIGMMVTLMRAEDLQVKMDLQPHIQRPDFGQRGWQMGGRTLLVVGLGGIGTDVARVGHALGMHVIATRASSHDGPDFVDYVGLSNELPDLIGKADVVAVTAPYTAETKGMFNAAMFARMKKGAIFVSTSREQLVVEPDLAAAVKSGQVGAAGFEINIGAMHEPEGLWGLPNVLITTHDGAPLVEAKGAVSQNENVWLMMRENMRRYTAGERMLSVAQITTRGY
jgi:phosphoglycerate dehydrogenase-like enzyme